MSTNRAGHYRFASVVALLLLFSGYVFAHELHIAVSATAPAVIVRATYGGTEPVPFAAVQVYAPGAPTEQFYAGRTDRRGYFSFVPERGGNWRLVVDDEEGHRSEANVDVPDRVDREVQTASAEGLSRVERALLGLALIVGFTGFFYGFKARHRS